MAGHKFKPERAGHLDSRLRRYLAPPERILGGFAPRRGETWAEIGAGTGYFAIPLSPQVEKVYALDLSEEMLTLLKRNLEASGAGNVEALKSEESSVPLADACADAVLVAFVLHEAEEPEKFLAEAHRITRPGGRLLVVEYTGAGALGPPRKHRLTGGQIDGLAAGAGYGKGRTWGWSRRLLGWKYFDLAGLEYRKQS